MWDYADTLRMSISYTAVPFMWSLQLRVIQVW